MQFKALLIRFLRLKLHEGVKMEGRHPKMNMSKSKNGFLSKVPENESYFMQFEAL